MHAISKTSRRPLVGLLVAVTTGMVWLGFANEASAQVNAGVDGGFAYRSSTPKLNMGMAYGAHLAVKPIEMVSVGAYYLGYDLGLDGAPNTVKDAAFRSYGGRVRFTLPIPESDFRPYGYVGMGYVSVSYPVSATSFDASTPAGVGVDFVEADGHFVEVPIGLGVGYKLAKLFELSLDFAIRPGFGFGGSAYDAGSGYDESKIGFTGLLGASVDL